MNVNPKVGLTFASALRAFLRQDPDVIMVGEIRDLETAEIAIKAAQTGHLVLSTLHTNDAPQTLDPPDRHGREALRDRDLGDADHRAAPGAPALQQLQGADRHAAGSAAARKASPRKRSTAGIKIYKPVGCGQCTDGYKGRVGIYQVMPVTEEIRTHHPGGRQRHATSPRRPRPEGIWDLRTSGLEKVKDGMTSLEEVNQRHSRVIASANISDVNVSDRNHGSSRYPPATPVHLGRHGQEGQARSRARCSPCHEAGRARRAAPPGHRSPSASASRRSCSSSGRQGQRRGHRDLRRQLATMLQAGIPLVQCFEIIGDGHEKPAMQKLMLDDQGATSRAAPRCTRRSAKHPLYFDDLFVNLVEAGEQAGALETLLDKVATYKEKTEALKKKIKKALFYPAAVLAVAVIVTMILLIFVIPQFEALFKGFGADLPAFTQMVIDLSQVRADAGLVDG